MVPGLTRRQKLWISSSQGSLDSSRWWTGTDCSHCHCTTSRICCSSRLRCHLLIRSAASILNGRSYTTNCWIDLRGTNVPIAASDAAANGLRITNGILAAHAIANGLCSAYATTNGLCPADAATHRLLTANRIPATNVTTNGLPAANAATNGLLAANAAISRLRTITLIQMKLKQ